MKNKNTAVVFVVLVIVGGILWYSGMWGRLWQKPTATSNDSAGFESLMHDTPQDDARDSSTVE